MNHTFGPYIVKNNKLVFENEIIEHPAVLIDIDADDICSVLKHGRKELLLDYYTAMVERLKSAANPMCNTYISDLRLFEFEISDNLSADNIATVLNAAVNCTGCAVIKALVNGDTERFHNEITILSRAGY